MDAYQELAKVFTRMHRFEHAASMLAWDQMVNMPPKGNEARAAAKAELQLLLHQLITDPALGPLLDRAEAARGELSTTEAANVREMRRLWRSEAKLPAHVVERKSLATSRAEHAWRTLRPKNDWNTLVPLLREVVDVMRQEARLLAEGTDHTPYEALLDRYEPDARVSTVEAIFAGLKTWLPDLIRKVAAAHAARSDVAVPPGPFPVEKQRALCAKVMSTLGFDFEAGRVDISSHPFCSGVPEDVRITTRYNEADFARGLMGVVHETGHARYEQGRPRELLTQPVSRARGMAVHESQSLFFEMQIGRSLPFLRVLSPLLAEQFGAHAGFEPEVLYARYTTVKPGLIRVDADELCYPMHVVLRFEIERALVEGRAEVDDIPALWSTKMAEYLGLDTAGDFTNGPMQDIHWPLGYIGYFPTYSLGAIYAAQWMTWARRDLGDTAVDVAIGSGDLNAIFECLRSNVWSKGSLLPTHELLRDATPDQLVANYKAYLWQRYATPLGIQH